MRDRDTVIRIPHSDDDPRLSATIEEDGVTLVLFFDREGAYSGAAPLEVRLAPTEGGDFRPWQLIPRLPLHLSYVRASLTHQRDGVVAALRALQATDRTRRGTSDDKLRYIAELYNSLRAEGEPYPVKALAAATHTAISTASRSIKAARERGFIEDKR
jgi:hypothetical protein